MNPKILTIIVSYNFMPWIDRCLGSLRHSGLKCDVMVVDNHSSDATVETIKSRYPEVRLVENKENKGFGAANNQGIEVALRESYEGVLLLNQDAWISENTMQTLVETAQLEPDAGIVSPVHMNGNGDKMDYGFKTYVGCDNVSQLPPKAFEVEFVNAAVWYIPINTFKRIGMFAPIFYHYGEDKDFVNRLHYHGLKVYVSPECTACHDREHRQVTDAQMLRGEYVYHLTRLTDVNGKMWTSNSLVINSLQVVFKAFKLLFKGRFSLATSMLGIVPKLAAKSCAAHHHRKKFRKKDFFSINTQ